MDDLESEMIVSSLLLCLTTLLNYPISECCGLGLLFFSVLKPPELQSTEFEEYWLSTQQKKQTPPLETSHAIPASHAEEKCKMMRWGGKRGLHRKRKRQQNKKTEKKSWEAMCLLSTNNHTAEKDLCRLKDKDGARSNNYEVAAVKKRLHTSKLSNHLRKNIPGCFSEKVTREKPR